jgi:hypothetical protein
MSLKIYSSSNMVAHVNTASDSRISILPNRVYKWPKNAIFYSFNEDSKYSISRWNEDREYNIGFNLTYGDFIKKDGTLFDSDIELQLYLDSILAVFSGDYKYEVAKGNVYGSTTWNKWGYNADVDIGAEEAIWSVGGEFTRLTTASGITVVSTSASDSSAGVGARSIVITAVDENWEERVIVVQLNGTTPVVVPTSTLLILGINRAAVYLSGTSTQNVGNINITATTGGSTQAQIPLNEGSTQQAFFFVQSNHTVLLDWVHINLIKASGQTPVVTIKAIVTSLVSGSVYEVARLISDTALDNYVQLLFSQPFVVGEKSLFKIVASTTSNNTAISARFSFVQSRNE